MYSRGNQRGHAREELLQLHAPPGSSWQRESEPGAQPPALLPLHRKQTALVFGKTGCAFVFHYKFLMEGREGCFHKS